MYDVSKLHCLTLYTWCTHGVLDYNLTKQCLNQFVYI